MTNPELQDLKPDFGLVYPPEFIEALPVLQPSSFPPISPPSAPHRSAPSSPSAPAPANGTPATPPAQLPYTIRGLTAKQFASLHTQYLTTHAPDSVIFPFLHGLEGDNDQQNAFFASAARMADGSFCPPPNGMVNFTERELRGMKAEVPRFRGLVWVASDEDEVEEYERALQNRMAASTSTAPGAQLIPTISPNGHLDPDVHGMSSDLEDDDDALDDDDDDYSTTSSQSDLDHFTGMPMDVDVDERIDLAADSEYDMLNNRSVSMEVDDDGRVAALRSLADHDEGAHMHPVIHHRPALAAIDTSAGKGESSRLRFASPEACLCAVSHPA